jgi:hypothetical protein
MKEMLFLAINTKGSKEEVLKILANKARELGYKPGKFVANTKDEPYNLISQMMNGIISNEVIIKRKGVT